MFKSLKGRSPFADAMPNAEMDREEEGQVPPNEDDTELLLCLLAEVEEQIAESRACVHGASNKLEESKEFETASAERQKEAQLSEATRRKLQRRSQIINAEVKSELAKAVAQLRHSSHHYRHVKGEIERALRQRDRRVMDYARSEGRAEALSDEVSQTKEFMRQLQKEKEDAEVRARRLQEEVDEQRKARTLAETHAKTLSATLEQEEEALRRQQEENQQAGHLGATLSDQLAETRALLEASESSNKQLTKSRDLLVAQLKNSKEVVARITADNLMFLNKIKHCETKLEQAVKEREVLRIDLNSADNRWFEHMRDELQKVTQSHLDAIDEYEARLQQVKEEAQSKTNEVSEQLQSTTEDLASATSLRDKYKDDLDRASQDLQTLRAEHDALTSRYQQLSTDHTALTNSNSDLQKRFADATLKMSQDDDLINLLKRKMQDASMTVSDASREVDQCRSENGDLREQIDRLNQEKSIVLKRMHDCEQHVISRQAEIDVLLKKNKSLEGDVASAREEKRRLERQLSLSVADARPSLSPEQGFMRAPRSPANSALQALAQAVE